MKPFYLPVFWAYVGSGFVGKTSSYLRIRRFIGRKVRRPPEAGEIAGKGVCKRFHARSLTWRSRWTQWLKRSSCYRSARWKRFSLVQAIAFCLHTTFKEKFVHWHWLNIILSYPELWCARYKCTTDIMETRTMSVSFCWNTDFRVIQLLREVRYAQRLNVIETRTR